MGALTVATAAAGSIPDRNYRHYVLGVLTLTYFMNFTDRQVLSVLLEDIKLEFSLSDLQLGLLSGLAFALFYSTLGIPIARLADRTNRVRIVAAAAGVWSVATAACGFVANFWQLFVARVLVGVGEAGCAPPTMSTLSDYYRRGELSRALAVLTSAAHVGSLTGVIIGGYVAAHYGWRQAFIVVGLPGLAVAALIALTVREPARGRLLDEAAPPPEAAAPAVTAIHAPIGETIGRLLRNRVYVYLALGHGLAVTTAYITANWGIVLYRRVFDVPVAEVGFYAALGGILGSIPGTIAGGFLSDRLVRRDPRWQCRLPAIGLAVATPLLALAPLGTTTLTAVLLFAAAFFFSMMCIAPATALMQGIVRPSERAVAASVFIFVSSGLGIGVGPLVVGALSDALTPAYGLDALRYAMLVSALFAGFGALSFFGASRNLEGRPATG